MNYNSFRHDFEEHLRIVRGSCSASFISLSNSGTAFVGQYCYWQKGTWVSPASPGPAEEHPRFSHKYRNVIFDLLHDNCIEQINPEASFQYYLLGRLWADIQRCIAHEIYTLNIATEPVQTSEIIDRYFPCHRSRVAPAERASVSYDMRTIYSPVWDSKADGYLYDRSTVLGEIGELVSIERSRLS
jgi:hypothetical protein